MKRNCLLADIESLGNQGNNVVWVLVHEREYQFASLAGSSVLSLGHSLIVKYCIAIVKLLL